MANDQQRRDAPLAAQIAHWNEWNSLWEPDRRRLGYAPSAKQAETVTSWLQRLGRTDLDILEVGCGTGWLCAEIAPFGRITGTDLADTVLARASQRLPEARFVPGDFMTLDFEPAAYDVVISLEVLSHVADQPAFLAKIASLLRPRGYLMLATQNRPQLERNVVPPPEPGRIRVWVDRYELEGLLSEDFDIEELFSIVPRFNRGYLRYVNDARLHHLLRVIGLGSVSRLVTRSQERAWMGWTLMALARKRA